MSGTKKSPHHHEEHPPHEEHSEDWLISYADLMTLLVGFFVIMMSFSQVDEEKFEQAKQSISKEFGGRYEVPYGDIADKIKDAIEKTVSGGSVSVKRDATGVEISFLGTAFFETGSADVNEAARELFDLIIPAIKAQPDQFKITIEGHTDDVPFNGAVIKNNWELSSIRACRVLEFFIAQGFKTDNMTAVGYGDARPVVPNRDANGAPIPANQSQNRRVVIKLTKADGAKAL